MGASTNAYLVYGICLEEHSLDSTGGGQKPIGSPQYLAYTGKDADGIRILTHCSCSYPMHIVSFGPQYQAERGYPLDIHARDLALVDTPVANKMVLEYVKKYNLKTTGMLGWHLCSHWSS
jgi:hypothetical protein